MDYRAGLEVSDQGGGCCSGPGGSRLGTSSRARVVGPEVLAESSELFRKKTDKTVPGPGLSSFSSQGLKGNGRRCSFLGSW